VSVLLDRVARSSVERLILGSSMCVYGEGQYRNEAGSLVDVERRRPEQLRRGAWEVTGSEEGCLTPIATAETKAPSVVDTVYPASKNDQERMCLRFGRAFGVPTMALRFFNVFGARQSLVNPYTGELARFASRILAGRRPLLSEDGGQLRDFVDVRWAAVAARLAMTSDTRHEVVNVGTGRATTFAAIARQMADVAGTSKLAAEATGSYQLGDVRHCFADVTRAESLFGPAPSSLDGALIELLDWVARETHGGKGRTLMAPVQLEMELAS
jgi:dTDP-L-rhamnose 4-epimerase